MTDEPIDTPDDLPDDEPDEVELPGPEDGAVEAPRNPHQAPPVDLDLELPAGVHDDDGQ